MKNQKIALLLAAGMLLGLLSACGSETASAASVVSNGSEAAEEVAASSGETEIAAPKADQVASAGEMTTVEDVVEAGMTPV